MYVLQYLSAQCDFRNSCWFEVPDKVLDGSCGGRQADWVVTLFMCGRSRLYSTLSSHILQERLNH